MLKSTCAPSADLLNDVRKVIPLSLQTFLKDDIVKDKNSRDTELTAVRPRSFLLQIHIGLRVYIHRKYESKLMLDILSKLGISASYKETALYEVSAVMQQSP